jgi:hypothetical protein
MRGAGSSAVAFVVEDDRKSKKEDQTIFWIRPKNTKLGAYASRRYTSAFAEGDRTDYDPEEWLEAIVEDFCLVVLRIDNYAFSPDYLATHPDIKSACNEDGFYEKPITDPEMIRDVATDLPDGVATEIINSSSNRVRLDAGAKKNLNWSPSLASGGPLPQSDGAATTATSA